MRESMTNNMDLKGPQIRSSSGTLIEAANTLWWCRLRVRVSGRKCTALYTQTQYMFQRKGTHGFHGDMAKQPLVHSHKTEKSLMSRQMGKGEDTIL